VLVALPEARLVLRPRVFGSATATKRLLAPFAEAGCAGRVELRADAPSFQDALRGYRDLDVALDTFPYHGTTTTCDALLMGVPVVSLMGSTPAARVSRSLLGAVGLDDLATEDASAFVEAAARLALDTGRLDTLRAELRERVLRGPLGDARGLARGARGRLPRGRAAAAWRSRRLSAVQRRSRGAEAKRSRKPVSRFRIRKIM
jgi:protein O-GlcNAc transferase